MTVSLEAWLMIVIPELVFFFVWCLFCIMSIDVVKVPKKKKPKEVVLRKSNYPYDSGEPVIPMDI